MLSLDNERQLVLFESFYMVPVARRSAKGTDDRELRREHRRTEYDVLTPRVQRLPALVSLPAKNCGWKGVITIGLSCFRYTMIKVD